MRITPFLICYPYYTDRITNGQYRNYDTLNMKTGYETEVGAISYGRITFARIVSQITVYDTASFENFRGGHAPGRCSGCNGGLMFSEGMRAERSRG